MFTYSIKREIRHFHVVVVQKRAKKCTRKRDAHAKMLFCLKSLLFFLTFSLPSASLDLKVPNNSIADNIGLTNNYIIRLINHNDSADLHTSIHPRLYMTTKFSDFSEKLSANMLFYSGRDMDVNIDVTIGIKFCQPCSSQFALFKKKNVLIIFLPMEL